MSALTARRMEVLRLLADGMTNGDIARQLRVSPNTVRTHVERIRRELGASTRGQAVAKAREKGLLE